MYRYVRSPQMHVAVSVKTRSKISGGSRLRRIRIVVITMAAIFAKGPAINIRHPR